MKKTQAQSTQANGRKKRPSQEVVVVSMKEGQGDGRYYFGGLKKTSLDELEVFGTICSSISEKEINSLELTA